MAAPGVGPAPRPTRSPLQVQSYEGLPLGMITWVPKNEIPDGGAFYIQDALLDLPGVTRRRGPLTDVSGMVTFTNPVFGAASCYAPDASFHIGVLEGTAVTGYLSVLSSTYAAKTQIAWANGFSRTPYPIVDSKQMITGGALIGVSTQYDENAPTQQLAMWLGGANPDYATGTITVAQGATIVTGVGTVWSLNASSGMFLFDASGHLVGTVKSVVSDTSITLVEGALIAVTGAAYSLKSLRGLNPRVTVGEITCGTAAATVTGSNTKFKKQGLDTGTWDIYRQRDYAFIGTVTSVTNDTSLTLTANAAIACNVDNYVAIRRDGDYTTSTTSSARKLGFLTAPYANRQFYANRGAAGFSSYLWFSEANLPECVDMSTEDGDFIPISSGTAKSAETPIKALMPAFRSLLILKDDEAFALTGTEPEQFVVDKVFNDGCLSGMSVQQWRTDVIWAGRNGIYVWDGTTVTDLMEKTLGKEYKAAIAGFDPSTYRMWSAVSRDHYMLYIENVTPDIGVTKGQTTTIPSKWTVVVNMTTGAVVLWTNVEIRGSITLPSNKQQKVWILVNDTSNIAHICDTGSFFDSTGTDTVNQTTTSSGTGFTQLGPGLLFNALGGASVTTPAGPDWFIESKRYPLGDPLRRKLIKQIALYYQSYGDGLTIDTVVGLGSVGTGTTNTTAFPQTSYTWQTLSQTYPTWAALGSAFPNWDAINKVIWGKKRYKFLKHDNLFGFRIYQNSMNNSLVQLGPWQFGFKVQAPGRI